MKTAGTILLLAPLLLFCGPAALAEEERDDLGVSMTVIEDEQGGDEQGVVKDIPLPERQRGGEERPEPESRADQAREQEGARDAAEQQRQRERTDGQGHP